ncbi:hypothetical protein [Fusobacterium sp. PH5-44]|uniref:hypothetical protein n=1 Tax=unclassified Fusobacterium TaxID=2648384 RepID=UPI003D24229D
MKKIVSVLILFVSFWNFANTEKNVLEDRIRNTLKDQYKVLNDREKELKIKDYDVDIFEEHVNMKIEIGRNIKSFDYDNAIVPLKEFVLNETQNQKNINIIVRVNRLIGKDRIVYDRTFIQNATLNQAIIFVGGNNLKITLVTNDNWETAKLMDNSEVVYALKRVPAASGMKLTNDSGVSIHIKNGEVILILNNGKGIKVKEVNK